jgi:hypothetical protein
MTENRYKSVIFYDAFYINVIFILESRGGLKNKADRTGIKL